MAEHILAGWAIDLITEGVSLRDGRSDVVLAVRRVMLSAHRTGMRYENLYPLLVDVRSRRLAHQIAHGRGGRRIAPLERDRFLRNLWDATAQVAARRPPWTTEVVEELLAVARNEVETTEGLSDNERTVMLAVVGLAESYGTTRPVVPLHRVATVTGLPKQTVWSILSRLSQKGVWLRKAKKGNASAGRAALYVVCPEVLSALDVWGAPPPMSANQPMSDPPMSENAHERERGMTVTLSAASPAALAEAIKLLAARDPAEARRIIDDLPENVLPLRAEGR